MSIILHGIGLGGGIAIGYAYILDKNLDYVTQQVLEDNEIDAEVVRFTDAIQLTRRELELLRNNIPENAPAELGAFLSLSIMMLNDSQIAQAPIDIIRNEKCNVEWAVKLQADKLSERFDEMSDNYLKERKYDVLQVLERIFKNLEGNKFNWDLDGKLERGILVTHDLSPADLVHFRDSNFSGFITDAGSLTAHTTIIGKNLDIPAIVGTAHSRALVREDDLLILDGLHGVLIINPEPLILEQYKQRQAMWREQRAKLSEIRKEQTVTLDGVTVELLANIDSVNDLADVKYNQASGIGLFRSELLYLSSKDHLVNEEEQFETYLELAKSMKKLPVIIRTADLGADKNPIWNLAQNTAMNPALGLIGIRLSLAETAFFRMQLRAILRASHYGNLQILFPMISSVSELKQALYQLEYAKEELKNEGVSFNQDIKVGAMIEVPSAAFAIKSILALVDFISIGTNDLIQYLLAIDRNDEAVTYLYNPLHPAVIKLLLHVIRSSNRSGVPVSICGEIAGDLRLTRLLLGMGLRKFSMYSSSILKVKQIVLNTNIGEITAIVAKILKTEDTERIEELVQILNEGLNI
jgi:phosphotransferase system enzyme I (PtsI)